jgi:hypothetical protein
MFSIKYYYINVQQHQFRNPTTKVSDSWTKTHRPNTLQYTCGNCNLKAVQFQFLRHRSSQRLWFINPTYNSALAKHAILKLHQISLYRIHYRPVIRNISIKSLLLYSKSDLCLLSSSYKYLYDHGFLSLN